MIHLFFYSCSIQFKHLTNRLYDIQASLTSTPNSLDVSFNIHIYVHFK